MANVDNNSTQHKLEGCCLMGGEYVQNLSDASFADLGAAASASTAQKPRRARGDPICSLTLMARCVTTDP